MSKASKNTSHRKLFTVGGDAPFQFVEAYKSLRTNLEFLSSAGNCKTILILSLIHISAARAALCGPRF